MYWFLTALHVLSAAIVVGVLFVQSLGVVMALRIPGEAEREGIRTLQRRMHLFIYYPILALTLLLGLYSAMASGAFTAGTWLHWKLVFVILLIGLGLLTGQGIRAERPVKPLAMLTHILIFVCAFVIIYLAVAQPF